MPATAAQVPDDLMQELHAAAQRFHAAREELERWLNASEFRHQERVDAAAEQLRAAEREVEDVEERIKKALAAKRADA